ncbi:MAG TPA: hypothetical protein DCY13_14505 [Verrucomicrobiales bacterium]|nr:hypothetical protein [Verrucomicrobiales bacterium]
MSKQANPAKVGAFVLVGIAILVITIGLLGSARLFAKPVPIIMYFSDSVNGLAEGSAVKFKGVTIGYVKSISLAMAPNGGELKIPVVVELDENSLKYSGDEMSLLTNPAKLESLIEKGLRATLETESLITGRLYVSLNLFPGAGTPRFFGDESLPEIPTQPTGLVEFIKSLSTVDLGGMANQLNQILDRLNTSLGELQVKQLNDQLAGVLASMKDLVDSPKWIATVDSFRETSDKARDVLGTLQAEVKPLGANFTRMAEDASRTFGELQRLAADLQGVVADESPLMTDLQKTLAETALAARSLRELTDELSRNPALLIKGRYQGEP